MIAKYDICIFGHITRGMEVYKGKVREYIGGAPYFISLALKRLGALPIVITKVMEKDENILNDIKENKIEIFNIKSSKTTSFRINYGLTLDDRQIRVNTIADPFIIEDLNLYRESKYIYIGPLTTKDFSLEFIKEASRRAPVILDVQGFTREVSEDKIIYVDWPFKTEGLKYVSIFKLDTKEVELITGTSDVSEAFDTMSHWGAKEIVLTSDKGVHVYLDIVKKSYFAPFIVDEVLGRIGRGDTCLAAYIFAKLKNISFENAVKFAAAVTSLKLRYPGPLKETQQEVLKFIKTRYHI
ncbi:MAG: PfkB family carbohydrate kinase [Nitrososphaeria archaeon]